MAGICFFFESYDTDVWSGHNLDAWIYACKAAGDIDRIIVINKTKQKVPRPDLSLGYDEVKSIEEAIEIMDGHITQIVCPWDFEKTEELWSYDHNTDWYIFGPATGWVRKDVGDAKVTVPQAGIGACHSVHIATVILMNRFGVLN